MKTPIFGRIAAMFLHIVPKTLYGYRYNLWQVGGTIIPALAFEVTHMVSSLAFV